MEATAGTRPITDIQELSAKMAKAEEDQRLMALFLTSVANASPEQSSNN